MIQLLGGVSKNPCNCSMRSEFYNSRWTVQREQSMTWCSNMTKSTSSHYKKQLFHPHTTKQLASKQHPAVSNEAWLTNQWLVSNFWYSITIGYYDKKMHIHWTIFLLPRRSIFTIYTIGVFIFDGLDYSGFYQEWKDFIGMKQGSDVH